MYVVTLPARRADDAEAFAALAKERGADLLEVRGDLTPEPRLNECPLPILYAPRGASSTWAEGRLFDWLDLEDGEWAGMLRGERLVRSYHDYERTPTYGELEVIARELWEQGADQIKIATRVVRPLDLLVLKNLREQQKVVGPTTVLGMGPLAALDRWSSPWTNASTYAFVPGHAPSAEGQIGLDAYERLAGETPPHFFGIIGGPGLRTFSPAIHNLLFARHEVRARYLVFGTEDLGETWKVLERLDVQGLSVTAPFKQEIIDKVFRLDELAARLGSVNTCVRERGLWVGRQFDVEGIVAGHPELRGRKRAAVVGSGGVVPAVIEALRRLEVPEITVFARDEKRRRYLASEHEVAEAPLEDFGRRDAEILVWALPIDRDDLALPAASADRAFAIDLRYGARTEFMDRAEARGFHTSDGRAMLLAQACAQFEAFTGIAVNDEDRRAVAEVLDRLTEGLRDGQ